MENNDTNFDIALTTIDNPYDPFDDFLEWFRFDEDNGYSTCSKIARIANVKDYMSNTQKEIETEKAIDSLVENDPLNMYIKRVRIKKDMGEGV